MYKAGFLVISCAALTAFAMGVPKSARTPTPVEIRVVAPSQSLKPVAPVVADSVTNATPERI